MEIVKAYLLADKAHSAPVPTPVDPVSATIEMTGNIDIYYHMKNRKLNPPASQDISTVRWWQTINNPLPEQIQANFGVGTVGGEVTLRLYDYGTQFNNQITDCYLYNLNGGFKLTIGNQLQPGNYVFECIWYIGPYSTSIWSGTNIYSHQVQVVNPNLIVIKPGAHGVVEAQLDPTVVTYDVHGNYGIGGGRVVKIVTRYAFTIEQGDTTKIFTFGPGKDFDFLDVWDYLYMWTLYADGSLDTDQFMDTQMRMMVNVYTAQ